MIFITLLAATGLSREMCHCLKVDSSHFLCFKTRVYALRVYNTGFLIYISGQGLRKPDKHYQYKIIEHGMNLEQYKRRQMCWSRRNQLTRSNEKDIFIKVIHARLPLKKINEIDTVYCLLFHTLSQNKR